MTPPAGLNEPHCVTMWVFVFLLLCFQDLCILFQIIALCASLKVLVPDGSRLDY